MTGLLHAVAAFLLTLVGYSGGAVLAAAAPRPRPAAWELPVSAAAGVAGASLAPDFVGAWLALPAAVAGGAAVGGAAGGLGRLGRGRRRRPSRDFGAATKAGIAGPGTERPDRGRSVDPGGDDGPALRRFLLRLGDYQGQITMGFLYYGLLGPFAAVSRLTGSPLRVEEDRPSYWRERPADQNADPEDSMRRQA